MFKSRSTRIVSAVLVTLIAGLVLAACSSPAAPSTPPAPVPYAVEASRPLGSVTALPSVVAPKAAVEYIGANFVPGESVTVVLLMDIAPGKTSPLENAVAAGANGLKVNASGAFYISGGTAPEAPGAYGVRVYDAKGKMVASSVFLVKAPPAPAK